MIKQCILIGAQGSGKTTLFNKICQKEEPTSSRTNSCTKIITTSQSKGAFRVVDTPGISFMNEIFQHSITVLAALTNGPINKILLIVQYENRLDKIEYMISKIIRPVQKYSDLIGVVITHFDSCKQEDIQQFQSDVTKMCKIKYSINQIIFSGLKTTGEELAWVIQDSLFQRGLLLQISDDDFDEIMLEHQFIPTLEEGKQKIKRQFRSFKDTVQNFLTEFYEIDDQDQILHSLLVFVRQEQDKFQKQFEKEYGPIMEDLHQKSKDPILAYYYYYIVKYQIKQMVTELTKEINQRMQYPEDHPFRQLRRCPNCDTIWLKVIGCDDTYCGDRLEQYEEIWLLENQPIYPQYLFYYKNPKQIGYNQIYSNIEQEIDIRQKQMKKLENQDFQIFFDQFEKNIFQHEIWKESDFDTETSFTKLDQSKIIKIKQKAQTTSPFRRKVKKILLEDQQQKQLKKHGQVGCGNQFDWESAPLVNIEDIDLDQKEILILISNNEAMYKSEYQVFKNEQIQKALKKQKNL